MRRLRRLRYPATFLAACIAITAASQRTARQSQISRAAHNSTGVVAAIASEAPSIDDIRNEIAQGNLPDSIYEDYQRMFPGLSKTDVLARIGSSNFRAKTNEAVAAKSGSYAGVWFDFIDNVWNVYSTDLDEAIALAGTANSSGLRSDAHQVKFSLRQLHESRIQVEQIIDGERSFALSVEPRFNAVVLKLPSSEKVAGDRAAAIPGTIVQYDDNLPDDEVPASCTNRNYCGAPLRGGVNVGFYNSAAHVSDIWCTVGFTAHATDGSRWIYTAGHCIDQSYVDAGIHYGHGNQSIGPVRSTHQGATVDAARIHIVNSYWLSAGGGYIYDTTTSTIPIDYVIIYETSIAQGDIACYSGRNDQVGDDKCGVISATNVNGKPQISGVKICGGDSGGPAFGLIGTEVWAFGILSVANLQQSTDCTPSPSSLGQGSFSSIPHINDYMDSITSSNIRVESH